MAGGRIEIIVDPDVKGFDGKLRGAMAGPLSTAGSLGKQLGVALGVGSVAAVSGAVMKIGNDFTNNLNTLRAVSQATDQQLSAVSSRAKELGSDSTLVGVSAGDAAAAMTELAKGGMSVEQSMSAARGTLQLAGAAQIDAARAATIQSSALQAFSLDASQAGRVSDILANTANASSAEITDVAAAMQQAGTVCNQFGVDVDDTATAIAMFANAGIKGSDAGTLLKTSLLALTDQGKPAQEAISELGLTVYDAQGKFVGLPALFGQLADAQKRMTPEAYQAATATLFGSDAMRLAGIAAQQGKEGFDKLNVAINRQGAAAEVAAARTRGLPGALNNLQNQAETAGLAVYQMVQGPLTGLANFAAGGMEKLPGILDGVGHAAAPAASALGGLAKFVLDLPGPVQTGLAALVALRVTGLGSGLQDAATRTGGAFRRFGEDLATQQRYAAASGQEIGRLNAGLAVMENRSPAIRRMGESYRSASAPLQEFASRHRSAASAAEGLAMSSTGAFTRIDALTRQMGHSGAAAAGSFGAALRGTAAGGLSAMKSGVGGVVGALGGPWMLGLSAAVGVAGAFTENAMNARAATAAFAAASAAGASAQHDLYSALVKSNGAMTDSAKAAAVGVVQSELDKTAATAKKADGTVSKFLVGSNNAMGVGYGFWQHAIDGVNIGLVKNAAAGAQAGLQQQALADACAEAGIKTEDAARIAQEGGPRWNALLDALGNTGEAGAHVALQLARGAAEVRATAEAASHARPGALELGEAYRLFADKMSSTADKANALKAALDGLTGKHHDAAGAEQAHNDAVRQLNSSLEQGWDAAKGTGDALVKMTESGAQIDTTTENGSRLRSELIKLRDTTADVAASHGDMNAAWASNEDAMQRLAAATGLPIERIKQLAATEGLLPEVINMAVKLEGAEPAVQEIGKVAGSLAGFPPGKTIQIECENQAAIDGLRSMGWTVEQVPGTKDIKVTATTEAARAGLAEAAIAANQVGGLKPFLELISNANQVRDNLQAVSIATTVLPNGHIEVTDTSPENIARLNGLNIKTTTLDNGHVEISDTTPQNIGNLINLSAEAAKPKPGQVVITDNSAQVRSNVDANLQGHDTSSVHTITINTIASYGGSTTIDGVTARVGNYYGADGGIFEAYADGGITRLEQYANGKMPLDYNPVGTLPASAVIQKPVGSRGLVQWAEGETDGEAFIPLAKSKRKRSLQIWAETGRRLGAFGDDMRSAVSSAVGMVDYAATAGLDELNRGEYNSSWGSFGVQADNPIVQALLAQGSARRGANTALASVLPAEWTSGGAPVLFDSGEFWLNDQWPFTSFADGGILASGLIEYAKKIEGEPYLLGGWGNGFHLTDCSGAQSLLANYVSGQTGRFATGSEAGELARRGFLPGPGKPGDLRIGWFNGGQAGGHTAGTLPNGVNVEMGGARNNGQYGGGAAGYNLNGVQEQAHFPMERFADLDKAVKKNALDTALSALGQAAPAKPADVSGTSGVDGSSGVGASTKSISDKPKSISELMGQFGKDLFTEVTSDTLKLIGKSDNLGPLGEAVLALEEANSEDPGKEGAYEKAKLASDRAQNRVTDLEESVRKAKSDLDDKRKPKEIHNSKGEVTRTEAPDEDAIRDAQGRLDKAERDLETAKRAAELAKAKASKESSAFGPASLRSDGVPVAGAADGGDGPVILPGMGDSSEVINYSPEGGTAQWRPLIKIALQRTGQSPGDAQRTETQMEYESGGDPNITNGWDSNAAAGNPSKGLMQVIETTYRGVKGKWPEHFTGLPDDLLSPLTNIVAGIDACVNSWGSLAGRWPTRAGYADGGKFMATGVADRVAPSTFRIIGDNPHVDEYYLPDNNDPRTLAFGAEWAERRGFQLLRMDQRPAAPARELVGAAAARPGVTVVNHGFDRREVAAGIEMADRRARFAARRDAR